jgi:type IV secretory pathway component VirB8
MDEETKQQFMQYTQKIDAIYVSVEKTRKYFLWTLIITLVLFVLPLLGLVIILPRAIGVLTGGLL